MFNLVVIITVTKPSDVGRVAEALARMRSVVRAEPGCVSWEALHSTDDPTRIVLVERWASRERWEQHDALEGIQRIYLPHVLPFVTREIHGSSRLGLEIGER